jgi:hypothetical protein
MSSNAGVITDAIDDAGALAPAWPKAHVRVRRWAALLVVLALVVTGALVALDNVRDDTSRVRDDLAATDELLDAERVAVGTAGAQRERADATLAATIDRLGDANDARHDVEVYFRALRNNLREQQAKLQSTNIDAYVRTQQLNKLNECLTGVATAMRQASYDAQSRVIETLQSVARVCEEARALTGSG